MLKHTCQDTFHLACERENWSLGVMNGTKEHNNEWGEIGFTVRANSRTDVKMFPKYVSQMILVAYEMHTTLWSGYKHSDFLDETTDAFRFRFMLCWLTNIRDILNAEGILTEMVLKNYISEEYGPMYHIDPNSLLANLIFTKR